VCARQAEREFFIDNLLIQIHFIIEMILWTGLAPWEVEFPFPCLAGKHFRKEKQKLKNRPNLGSSPTPAHARERESEKGRQTD